LEREPECVRADVLEGKVSREHARSAYGVVIDDDTRVNAAATRAMRAALRAATRPATSSASPNGSSAADA
jgi:N-methylhydantoinase B